MEQEINQQQLNRMEQKNGGKIKILIFVGVFSSIIGALVMGVIVYLVLNSSYSIKQEQLTNQISTLQNQINTLTKQAEIALPSSTLTPADQNGITGWKTYENKEIGISFKYPSEYGDFSISINNGETGKKYTGDFQNNKVFSIGGITRDFTEGRSAHFLDFVKYLSESGKYYHLWALGRKALVEPVKILNVDGQKILIVNGDSYVEERNVEGPAINPGSNGGALVNLPNNGDFEGLAIWNSDIETLSQSRFEEILATFKFTK